MRLAALFSGGKDSTYAIFAAKKLGHNIECLITISPKSEESHFLHFPNIDHTKLQAQTMGIPQIFNTVNSINTDKEVQSIREILSSAKDDYNIEGIVHGGILSKFQKNNFAKACKNLDLSIITPIWRINQSRYMQELLDNNFEFILTSVTTDGLDDSWLGRIITKSDLKILERLSQKYSFNISFEGGEAETFVVSCPLFSKSIEIKGGQKVWDGYRGRFEIQGIELNNHA